VNIVSSQVVVPQLGESVVEARVARWLKKAGDAVSAGEPLVELETEKIDLEVGAEHAGVLREITRQEGEDVQVGEVLGVIDAAAPEAESSGPGARAEPETAPPPAARAERATEAPAPAAAEPSQRGRATPTARRVAATHDVDLGQVPPSGEAGRVIKRDVESYVQQASQTAAPGPAAPNAARASTAAAPPAPSRAAQQAAPAAPPEGSAPPAGRRTEERVRMSKRRLTIARNLVEAQHTAALLTTFNEVDMSAVMDLRERRKDAFKKRYGVSLGIASFFVKASIGALRAFPRLNAEIQGEEMVLKHYYDVGIAVGAPQGLVVPVLRNAERLSFAEVEIAIRDYAHKASDGALTLDDLKGGTFTISNGGVFGSLLSTPIVNPPQVGILGLHKIEERPVAHAGQVVVRPMMYVALTYDHRMVDGLEAVQFLVRVKEFIEDPGHLLLES
jgi:2-oxoglutarate dehydrogenase E2 component (dihydrolipoamide succinyltransferase)